jgi:heterodisulfide reductase subunit A-like polyferredoxin
LNPYLFEMANIRNQCSWVHSHEWDVATNKAKDLVRMAVAKAAQLEPQHTLEVPVEQSALVIGGGAAGMMAAISLAGQGFPVHLVEQEDQLGGNLRHVFMPSNGKDPQQILRELVKKVETNPAITIHLSSRVTGSSGFMGNFTSILQSNGGGRREIKHGVTILATGAQEYRGPEYGFGSDPRILTQQQFEARLASNDDLPGSVVMIQCIGPAEQYCSRICCTVALKNALALKDRNPDAQVVILHRDIRAYGFKERLYTEARERGVIFVRYDDDHRPAVDHNGQLTITAWDAMLRQPLSIQADLLVLSMPAVPRPDAAELSTLFKASLDADGFFLEAHVKLRPVDFATDGVFMAGMAHYPKLLDESMIQAQAAASRAARVLSRETLMAGGRVAVVDEAKCTGCLTCVRICPFSVPQIKPNLTGVGNIMGAAFIEAAVCQGCGSCVAECPAQAIQLMHYTDVQMDAKVDALLDPTVGFVALDQITSIEGAN